MKSLKVFVPGVKLKRPEIFCVVNGPNFNCSTDFSNNGGSQHSGGGDGKSSQFCLIFLKDGTRVLLGTATKWNQW